jgi:hypothetical protein
MLLTYILEVPGSNLVRDINYSDSDVSWVYPVPPDKCRNSIVKLGHDLFFEHHLQFIIR